MRRIHLLVGFLCLFSSPCAAQLPAPADEQNGDGMVSALFVLPSNKFTDASLLEMAKEYLSRHERIELIEVGFYTDDETAWDSRGKLIDHVSYDLWKAEFEKRAQKQSVRAGVLLKYGSYAALRVRDADGNIREITIDGASLFHPQVGGVALDLLHVTFAKQGFGTANKLTAHFYFTLPGRVSSKEARSIAESFFRIVRVRDVVVHFREDEWFIFDTFYPWNNLFTRAKTPPTLGDSAKSVEYLCKPSQGETCYQTSLGKG
jgi:hypothetical protein